MLCGRVQEVRVDWKGKLRCRLQGDSSGKFLSYKSVKPTVALSFRAK